MRMAHDLSNDLWTTTLARLGGVAGLAASARETGAFLRPRKIKSADALLRFVLAYCLGGAGMRTTVAWGAAIDLADISDVALLGRLRNCAAWMEHLVGQLLAESQATELAPGRLVRLIDGTTVRKFGREARGNGQLWRLHVGFDLPTERFSYLSLTDEKGAEHLEMMPVIKGEIRIADRGYLKAYRLAAIIAAEADLIVRAGWKQARWCDADGKLLNMIALLKKSEAAGRIDQPIFIAYAGSKLLAVRLVAFRKPKAAIAEARTKARREASKEGRTATADALLAAEWTLLVTTLDATAFPADQVGDLYRSRWRIEMAFKRLKSILDLAGPPGTDPEVAKCWILAHLLMILVLEPHTAVVEDSPRWATREHQVRAAA
jgi:Transposase DDE domain